MKDSEPHLRFTFITGVSKIAKVSIFSDLKNIDFVSVMLQTGYLTFKEHLIDDLYIIGYPNKEVEMAFSKMLLGDYLYQSSSSMSVTAYDIGLAFKNNDGFIRFFIQK